MPSLSIHAFASIAALLLVSFRGALAFDNSRNDNLVVYYGQNSYGATNGNDQANWQKNLSTYCQDDTIDVFPLSFLHVFKAEGGLPSLDLANICSVKSGVFPGTALPNCQFLAEEIKGCQARGKLVTLSLGGATGAATFTSDADATAFATTLWDLFFGGDSKTRPFGDAILDGVDLDIEGGSTASYPAFVKKLQELFKGGKKKYYTTAAPQCPFPDAYLGSVINSAPFDAIYVQFYNNFCGVAKFSDSNAWNFDKWDTWAKKESPNKDVKIYIGAPAAPSAANAGSYVDANVLGDIAVKTRSKYSSFGGIMLWDASQARGNNGFDAAIKKLIGGGSTPPDTSNPPPPPPVTSDPPPPPDTSNPPPPPVTSNPPPPPVTSDPPPPPVTSNPPPPPVTSDPPPPPPVTSDPPTTGNPPGGNCPGVNNWASSVSYPKDSKVVYNGHLWTALWWSHGSAPGGPGGEWTDGGACTSKRSPNVGRFWRN